MINLCWLHQIRSWRRTVKSNVNKWRNCMILTSMTTKIMKHQYWKHHKILKVKTEKVSIVSNWNYCNNWKMMILTSNQTNLYSISQMTEFRTSNPSRLSEKTLLKQPNSTNTSANSQKKMINLNLSADYMVSIHTTMTQPDRTWEHPETLILMQIQVKSTKLKLTSISKCWKNWMMNKVMLCQTLRHPETLTLTVNKKNKMNSRSNWNYLKVSMTCKQQGILMTLRICQSLRHPNQMIMMMNKVSMNNSNYLMNSMRKSIKIIRERIWKHRETLM